MNKTTQIVVNTKTKEDYDAFMKLCERAGGVWKSKHKPTASDNWQKYKNKTCIAIRKETGVIQLTYSEKGRPASEGAISYQEFLTAEGLSRLQ